MKTRWNALTTSKKQTYLWGGLLCVVLIYFACIWYPFHLHIEEKKEMLLQQQVLATWIQNSSAELLALKKKQAQLKTQTKSLFSLIDTALKSSDWGNKLSEMKQLEINQVQVSFSNILFDDLIRGLEQLWNQDNVYVKRLNLQRTNDQGMVQAAVVLAK